MSEVVTITQPSAKPAAIVIEDAIPILDTGRFEHMQRIATVMAKCGFLPDTLVDKNNYERTVANCFMIVNQAVRWQMDPFALAQHAYASYGKIGYEGKVIAASINADPRVKGRLNYTFEDEVGTDARKVIASGIFADTGETRTIEGTTGQWKTNEKDGTIKAIWQGNCDQQLTYRAAREWARRWMPERLLGVYSSDEIDDIANRKTAMKDVTPRAMVDVPALPTVPEPKADKLVEEANDDAPLADQDGFIGMLESCLSSAESRDDLREIILGNSELTRRCSPENRARIAGLYQESLT